MSSRLSGNTFEQAPETPYETAAETNADTDTESSQALAQSPAQANSPSSPQLAEPVWLKNPAFLNGMSLALGYIGHKDTLEPVVAVKRDGRPHQNIRITLSVTVKSQHNETGNKPWIEALPLTFSELSRDYRSSIPLAGTVTGKHAGT